MNTTAIFGLSSAMSLIAGIVLANLYILPRLQHAQRDDALTALIIPHAFRFIGLSFLVPGVVSPSLQPAFAIPEAYGDLGAAILALIAVLALRSKLSLAIPLVWLFNIWGFFDLVHALRENLSKRRAFALAHSNEISERQIKRGGRGGLCGLFIGLVAFRLDDLDDTLDAQ